MSRAGPQGSCPKLEEKIESVAVADFRKVIERGGRGISVSYRIAGFAAFVTSALSTAIFHPIDNIKTRIQERSTSVQSNKPLFDDLYTGSFSGIMKEAPNAANAAIYLGVYEIIKSSLIKLSATSFFHDLPLITFLVVGALGHVLGSIVRVRAEIVNKRLQLGVNPGLRQSMWFGFRAFETSSFSLGLRPLIDPDIITFTIRGQDKQELTSY